MGALHCNQLSSLPKKIEASVREAPTYFFFFYIQMETKSMYRIQGLQSSKKKKKYNYGRLSRQKLWGSEFCCLASIRTKPSSSLKADFQIAKLQVLM
jgi:hypothetical protein